MNLKYEINKRVEKIYIWLASKILPKRLVLWCYIIVVGEDGHAPGDDYKKQFDFWCNKHRIRP